MGDGLLMHTMDGRITGRNPVFEKMMSYEKSEPIGKNADDLSEENVIGEDDLFK